MDEPDITKETVEDIASLARLNLSAAEVERFAGELASILDAFSVLDQVDTDGVEPAFHPTDVDRELRTDERNSSLSQEHALENAAETNKEDGYFKGPRAV